MCTGDFFLLGCSSFYLFSFQTLLVAATGATLAAAAPQILTPTGARPIGSVLNAGADYLDATVAASPAAAADPTLAETSVASIAALRAVLKDFNSAIIPAATTLPGAPTPLALPNAGKAVGDVSIDELAAMVQALTAQLSTDPNANPTGLALLKSGAAALKAVTTKLQVPAEAPVVPVAPVVPAAVAQPAVAYSAYSAYPTAYATYPYTYGNAFIY